MGLSLLGIECDLRYLDPTRFIQSKSGQFQADLPLWVIWRM